MAPPNRPADLPKSTNDTACFFFWLQKYSWVHLAFSWHQLVKIPLIFVPSQRIENRWTLDGKTSFFRWFWFKRKELKNVRFLAWKTSEKRLFYRLNRNSFMFKLFGMLHRQIIDTAPINNCRQATIRRYRQTVQALRTSAFLWFGAMKQAEETERRQRSGRR